MNIHTQAYDNLARRAQEMVPTNKVDAALGRTPHVLDGRTVYVLSMGHRLQTLSYDEKTHTVSGFKFSYSWYCTIDM